MGASRGGGLALARLKALTPLGTVDPLVQTAEHLTAASLRRTPTPTAPLPPSAAGGPNSAYAEALIRQQEERQQVPAVDRANSTFKEDVEVPDKFRAKLQDYFRSGYDRGHMVPAYVVHNTRSCDWIHWTDH